MKQHRNRSYKKRRFKVFQPFVPPLFIPASKKEKEREKRERVSA
jgi:hypothetical protein